MQNLVWIYYGIFNDRRIFERLTIYNQINMENREYFLECVWGEVSCVI